MRDLLLELGVEELPASHLQGPADFIRAELERFLKASGLTCQELRVSSTPRRFFALLKGLQELQADDETLKTGPARGVAYDAQGQLTPAGTGFLKKNSASPSDIFIQSTEKGEFIALRQIRKGRAAPDLVREWLQELLPRIPFPKTMLWNESRLAFSRPLRWLCLLWGGDVIPFEVAGVSSGKYSYGNRYLGLERQIIITSPGTYEQALQENGVVADREQRRRLLLEQIEHLVRKAGLRAERDERLADTVTDLVEQPTAVMAEFDAEFLSLPEKIITSTLSQNQKYFPVRDAQGRLSNKFVFISNGDPAQSQLIRKGNEKVVLARLADALWYYREDTRAPLESYLPKLEEVVFQSKLGTMADKTRRIVQLAERICADLNLDERQTALVLRTARLCKADLVTTMLGEKEFTKLQGYIGQQYALAGGENEEVAAGIYEHYQPRGNRDSLPKSVSGAVVAIADKLDSVCGIIGIGLLPTGSADPFALRRAGNGIVQICAERDWDLQLEGLISSSLDLVSAQAQLTSTAGIDVRAFISQRVEALLRQLELDYDVVESVLRFALGGTADLVKRARTLQSFRQREDFLRLVIGFKRASNIISEENSFPPLARELFREEEESRLHEALQTLSGEIGAALDTSDYTAAITLLVKFGERIDRFFDAVLVNCDDPALRGNRYALLNLVRHEFLRVADISLIVVEGTDK